MALTRNRSNYPNNYPREYITEQDLYDFPKVSRAVCRALDTGRLIRDHNRQRFFSPAGHHISFDEYSGEIMFTHPFREEKYSPYKQESPSATRNAIEEDRIRMQEMHNYGIMPDKNGLPDVSLGTCDCCGDENCTEYFNFRAEGEMCSTKLKQIKEEEKKAAIKKAEEIQLKQEEEDGVVLSKDEKQRNLFWNLYSITGKLPIIPLTRKTT